MVYCKRLLVVSFCVLLTQGVRVTLAEDLGLKVPEGFEVSLYAGDDLAHDIFSMTIDSQGRVVVSGLDYIKTLHDTDEDGVAERATLFSRSPRTGAHGMYFDGADLICSGDNTLMRMRDRDGDAVADGEPEILAKLKTPEHGTNGVVKGPDGWFYVICGNDAGVSSSHATTRNSPVLQPQCGAVVRFSPDGKRSEIVAHGFRNPYDLDFNQFGHVFTVDADGERDQYLPWYSPTRLFDISQGMHHGWVLEGWKRSWNRHAYNFDSMERLVEVGRGSPTGVICYRHKSFPQHYRGGVFSCGWTLGRVYFFPLRRKGSTYASQREIFLETTGEVGFAPVDLAVGPSGDLYVAIGGRRTRGSVFRVRYVGDKQERKNAFNPPSSQVLAADQPFASWSRARWVPLAEELGKVNIAAAILDNRRNLSQKIRALEILVELFDGVSLDLAKRIVSLDHPELTARLAWALSRNSDQKATEKILAALTHHHDSRIKRSAWEALGTFSSLDESITDADWDAIAEVNDRRVRGAAIAAAVRVPKRRISEIIPAIDIPEVTLARLRVDYARGESDPKNFPQALAVFTDTKDETVRQESVRLMQLMLGDVRMIPTEPDVYAGYTALSAEQVTSPQRRQAAEALAREFPTRRENLNREISRLLGMLGEEAPNLLDSISEQWTKESRLQDDIHYLIVMSLLPGRRNEEVTRQTAAALTELHRKMTSGRMFASRNWPLRVGEVLEHLCLRDPQLPAALISDSGFGISEHSLFVSKIPKSLQPEAIRKILLKIDQVEPEDGWPNELIRLLTVLPEQEYLPVLRSQWNDFGLRDSIISILAQHPSLEDRKKYIQSLASTQTNTVTLAANTLRKLGDSGTAEEMLVALRALKQYCAARQFPEARKSLSELLKTWSGEEIEVQESAGENLLAQYQKWFDWFAETHPETNAKLSGLGHISSQEWRERLASLDWSAGNVDRGKQVFQRRACARCHSGNARLGPDLEGVAGRLSREDLFAAIVDPHQDVSPLYQTTQFVTRNGKVYSGLVIYQSPDGTLVQTGPDTTIRIAGDQVVVIQKNRQSIMPTGLLNDAVDRDLADLYAYIKTLKTQR